MDNTLPSTASLTDELDTTLVQQAMALIAPAQRIALLAHEHPDGDCLGSALGLAHILQDGGKTCVPVCSNPAPAAFAFLPGIEKLQQTLGDEHFDLVIALDAGELSRYGSLYEQHRAFLDHVPVLNIDHHISSTGCGRVNILETSAAATAEIVVLLQRQAQLSLSPEAAICLLTGIITDTFSFQFPNTTPRTMEVGAILLRAGAVAERITKPLYRSRPLAQVRLQAAILGQAQTSCGGRLIWSYATDEMLAEHNAQSSMDEGIGGQLRDIDGVQIAAFFKNYGTPTSTRLSLRSGAPYNAAEICARFGGGGHARAAGAKLDLPLIEAIPLVLAELEQEILARDELLAKNE